VKTEISLRQIGAYGALGFPLAFIALPLYVHVPQLYASSVGLSLGLVGALLLLIRLADAVIDPWLGRVSDKIGDRRRLIALALPVMTAGLIAVLNPPQSGGAVWLVLSLMVTFVGFSLAMINYHAWGAELGETPTQRIRVTATREGLSLCGVIVAAALPSLLAPDPATALQYLGWVFVPIVIVAALISLLGAPTALVFSGSEEQKTPLRTAFADLAFRRLLVVLAFAGVASAIPATLVLFYINDVLQLPEWQGLFLAIYFVFGGLAMPAWITLARHRGKVFAWAISSVLAIFSFVWAFSLSAGDGAAFAVICALSGAALGAELAVPPALLADRLAAGRRAGSEMGGTAAYFGLWNFVSKFNLALAAGIALPLVGLAGYRVGAGDTPSADGLIALALVYAVLPALIKLVSLGLLLYWKPYFEEVSS
jgi:glycoside/pentoside/hexuronide:cation symporter, GPH family